MFVQWVNGGGSGWASLTDWPSSFQGWNKGSQGLHLLKGLNRYCELAVDYWNFFKYFAASRKHVGRIEKGEGDTVIFFIKLFFKIIFLIKKIPKTFS